MSADAPRATQEAVAPSAPSVGTPLLKVAGVGKRFVSRKGERTVAVDNVSFEAGRGEFIALVGPSGCGKTTMLKMATGLVNPSWGTIDYNGTGRPVAPGDYGMVFQSAGLLPWRTILANVMLPAQVLHLDKTAAKERAMQLLSLVRLDGAAQKYPGELSGGMQQRASIARALIHDPAILFMDEPFGALDAITRQEMGDELQRIHQAQRKTVLFVTHSIQEAVLLADRVLVFSRSPGQLLRDQEIPFPRPRTYRDTIREEFRAMEESIHDLL